MAKFFVAKFSKLDVIWSKHVNAVPHLYQSIIRPAVQDVGSVVSEAHRVHIVFVGFNLCLEQCIMDLIRIKLHIWSFKILSHIDELRSRNAED